MSSSFINSRSTAKLSVSLLLSPPEPKHLDTFSLSSESSMMRSPHLSSPSEKMLPSIRDLPGFDRAKASLPPSPPISPFIFPNKDHHVGSPSANVALSDPQLFRHSDCEMVVDEPLFLQEQTDPSIDALVVKHMEKNASNGSTTPTPTRDEYFLAISCVAKGYNRNPSAWLRRERQWLDQRYGKPTRVSKAPKVVSKKVTSSPNSTVRRSKTSVIAPRVPRIKRASQSKITYTLEPSDSPPKAARAPTNRDDVDYQSLHDFAPPLSTLSPGNNRTLKADWKGQMLDLSNDPDRHMLHDAEVHLAATLRLSCATYLCSKRRIFQARIDALRIGKEFRKTDAQQACKIDVNKASKLWSAYDRVGWFKPEYFEKYL